jgi:tetratricopeptide (TPR) repeat protein
MWEVVIGEVLADAILSSGRGLKTLAAAAKGEKTELAIARWFDTERLTSELPDLPDLSSAMSEELARFLQGNSVQAILHELLATRLTDAPEADVEIIRNKFERTFRGGLPGHPASLGEALFDYYDEQIGVLVGTLEGSLSVSDPELLSRIRSEAFWARMIARLPPAAVTAPVGGASARVVLPPPVGRLPERVRGRHGLVGELVSFATTPDGRVHVLAALGGSGKSTVALAVARQLQEAGGQVWWVSAADSKPVTGALLSLARYLGAADAELSQAANGDINPSDVLWPRLESRRRWLLVLDNADDSGVLAVGDRTAADGSGWLRPTQSGLVLVTSRTGESEFWGSLAIVHRVTPLSDEDGGRLLADLAPGAGSSEEAGALAARLGGMALALHQAGSYLGSPFAQLQTFTEYGDVLEERFEELLGRGDDQRARVIGTWELSLDALAAQGRSQARMLLRVVSCFAAGTVPVPPLLLDPVLLGQYCGGGVAVEEGLAGLLAVGLIETKPPTDKGARPLVMAHPLVVETTRYQAADSLADSFAIAIHLLSPAISHVAEVALHTGWHGEQPHPESKTLLPHMRALLGLEVDAPAAVLEVLVKSVTAMWSALIMGTFWPDVFGLDQAWLASLDIVDCALKRVLWLDEDCEEILALRFLRGHILDNVGSDEAAAEAEAEFRQVLAARQRALGSDHPDTGRSRRRMAEMLWRQGRFAEAGVLYREVIAAQKRAAGSGASSGLSTWWSSHLSRSEVSKLMNEPAETEAEARRFLSAQLPSLGSDHPDILATRQKVAEALAAQGKTVEAEAEYREILRDLLAGKQTHLLAARQKLEEALAGQGEIMDAEAEYQEALQRIPKFYLHDEEIRNEIARTLEARGKYAEAEAEYRRNFEMHAIPEASLEAQQNIARSLAAQGKHSEAEAEYRQILTVLQQVQGPDHPDTLTVQSNLAKSLVAQGKYADAAAEYQQILTARQRVLGPDHPDTVLTARSSKRFDHRGDRTTGVT